MKKFVMSVFIGGAAVLAPSVGRACACGCGIFDVGANSMLPQDAGGMAFIQYDFSDQDHNWSGTSRASADDNDDKEIQTHFFNFGGQYMFNRSWGVQMQVPYDQRYFKTTGGPTGDQIVSMNWSGLGDIRIEGLYTGFSENISSGLTFGVKLPTGSFTHEDAYGDIDRDSELGTGSTDLLLGGFYRRNLTRGNNWTWFSQAQLDVPVLTQDQYRPGIEVNAATGVYYKGWMFHSLQITPMVQVIASERTSDSGNYAAGGIYDDPDSGRASGYQRILISPGVEFDYHRVSVYADVEVPVFQDVVGNQLVSSWMLKVNLTYHF
jgi:hypothetical protein